MSKNEADVRLPQRAEELLASWPAPDRSPEEWAESAQAIVDRLPSAQADQALLEAPLPLTSEDGSSERAREPEPPKRSFLEMAKMVEASDEAADESDIARESFSLATRTRTSSPSIPDFRSSSPEVASATQTPVSAPAPASNVTSLSAEREKRSVAGPVGMVIVALAGIAAATVIFLQARQASESKVAMAPPPPAACAAAPVATAPNEEGEVVKLDELALNKGAARAGKSSNQGGASAVAEKLKAEPPSPLNQPTQKKKEEGEPEDSKMRPAEHSGDIPEKPALGAVQAAVGAVLGSARACVAGQDEPSNATITFGSDGKVQSVTVSGPAAGTPAAACIQASLSKARVQAFSRPTFSASTKVRP